jgi:ribonuclease P/MRP protein subunit RPP40
VKKLLGLGFEPKIVKWVNAFLSNRTQRVLISGKLSEEVKVLSGVPQGSVLGPLLFLLFINDLPQSVSSCLRLFADDCFMYRIIHSIQDVALLQRCLTALVKWCNDNGMPLNAKKCQCISFSLKKFNTIFGLYKLGDDSGAILSRVSSCKYLGVDFSSNLSFSDHISRLYSKANAALFSVQRSFKHCSQNTKQLLYFSLVRSIIEYASVIWDPYQDEYIRLLDKIQRRAARFVLHRYRQEDSVTDMLATLGWESLESRRRTHRLLCFYLVYSGSGGWADLNKFLSPATFLGRGHAFKVFLQPANSDIGLNSFINRTSRDWNNLAVEVFESGMPSYCQFKKIVIN